MDSEQIRAGFVRNRRFLIAVSLALACFDVLGLSFPQVTILGNSATVQHPERIALIAWIVWSWSLAQYIVWYRDVGAWKEFRRAVVDDCERRVGRQAAAQPIPRWLVEQLEKEMRGSSAEELGEIRYTAQFTGMGDGRRIDRAADIEATAHVRLPNERGEHRRGPIRFEREISTRDWRRYMITAWLRVTLTQRFVLEYFAPFLIGFLPVAVWLLRHSVSAGQKSFLGTLRSLVGT